MTDLEKWLKEAPEAEYYRDLRGVLDRMPMHIDVQARGRLNAAFQRAAEIAMGSVPSEERASRPAPMKYTVYFQPRTKISGVTEGSASFDSAKKALSEVDGLERSDERVRIVDANGREISRAFLEMYADRESR